MYFISRFSRVTLKMKLLTYNTALQSFWTATHYKHGHLLGGNLILELGLLSLKKLEEWAD